MDLSLSEEQLRLTETAVDFGKKYLEPHIRTFEANNGWSEEALSHFNELALNELYLSTTQENQEMLAAILASAELAAFDAGGLPLYLNPGPATAGLKIALTQPALASSIGDMANLFATTENFLGLAVSQSDEVVGKEFIGFGSSGAHYLIIVTNSSLIYVTNEDLEFTNFYLPALHASSPVKLKVKNPTAQQSPMDFSTLCFIRSFARLWVSSLLAGLAKAAIYHAINYGKERIVFNLPVLGHQANAFSVAKCVSMLEALKIKLEISASLYPCDIGQANELNTFSWFASSTYVDAIQTAKHITDVSVLLLGGHGYMEDEPVEKFWRETRSLSLLYGGEMLANEDLIKLIELVKDQMVV